MIPEGESMANKDGKNKKKKKLPKGDSRNRIQLLKSATALICTAAVSVTMAQTTDRICEAKLETAKTGAVTAGSFFSAAGNGDSGTFVQTDNGSGEYMPDVNGTSAEGDTAAGVPGTAGSTGGAAPAGNKTGADNGYKGPLLFMGVVPFDFSKADPDPSKWTTQQIVDCYKSGMAKEDHNGVRTDQSFELIGDLPGASALKSPINLAMKLGAQPFGALCGGYWDLQPSDLKKADAHRDGDYVVINLYPVEQVDGPKGKEHEGPVGHVANVVEGIDDVISYIEENYAILNAQYEDDSIVLKYSNAYAKNVRINTKTGKMESGTWGYDVDVYLDHCSLLNIKFNNFHTTIRWKCWYPVAD